MSASLGFQCQLVDVVSYEKFPRTFEEYARRNSRWARQTLQLVLYRKQGKLPLTAWLHLFMDAYGYLVYTLFLIGAMLVVWSGSSNLYDFKLAMSITQQPLFPLITVLLSFYIVYLFLMDLPLALAYKITIGGYFRSIGIRFLLSFYSMVPTCKGALQAFLSSRARFEVTGRKLVYDDNSCWLGIRQIGYLFIILLLLIIGIIRNPVSVLLNWFWIFPMVISPFFVLWINLQQLHVDRSVKVR